MLKILQKVWNGQVQPFLKTDNRLRDVDLHPFVASFLKTFIGDRTSGLLFHTKNGRPLSLSNILRRSLHKVLTQLGSQEPARTDFAGSVSLGCGRIGRQQTLNASG
jgi:hypothetical protein